MNFIFRRKSSAPEPVPQISQETTRIYLTIEFKALGDVTKNGRIALGEFVRLLLLLGYPEGEEGAEKLWKSLGKMDGQDMTLDEYIELMTDTVIGSKTNSWRKLFAQFDSDGNGYASEKEVLKALEADGIKITPEVRTKVKKMDANPKEGKISYAEFLKVQLGQ